MKKPDCKNLALVGKGGRGTIYGLGGNRCIKVCKKTKDMQKECRVLKLAKGCSQFPVVCECKGKYMIREYIHGQKFKDYIAENGISDDLAEELTQLIKTFIKLKFKRIDVRMQEVFITKDHKLKIIDTTRYLEKKASYPFKMLKKLKNYGCKEQYMIFLKENYPEFYATWNKEQANSPRS